MTQDNEPIADDVKGWQVLVDHKPYGSTYWATDARQVLDLINHQLGAKAATSLIEVRPKA